MKFFELSIPPPVVGLGIAVAGLVEFRRAKTTINPIKASCASSLVSGGIHRFTRDPMHLGAERVLSSAFGAPCAACMGQVRRWV